MSRRKFLKEFISLRINNNEVAEDYANTVETGYNVRNPFGHSPQFERSIYQTPLEQPEIYDINRVLMIAYMEPFQDRVNGAISGPG